MEVHAFLYSKFDAMDLLDLYDSTMEHLLDKQAPWTKIVMQKIPDCPWLDGICTA